MLLKSAKQRAWFRYTESRFGNQWGKMDETTKTALKRAWRSGWAARQAIKIER